MNLRITLSIIRWPNLLIIGIIQYFCRYFILKPILDLNNLSFFISNLDFLLLVCSTILIATGGYLINDYFDVENDLANQKFKKAKFIERNKRRIIKAYYALSGAGILLGVYLGYKVGNINLGIIFLLVAALLWFYSISYKRKILIGNLVIALLSSLAIIIVWIFVFYAFKNSSVQLRFNNWYLQLILGYIVFAFSTSFIREIIKDAEDADGDKALGMKTLPISIGIRFSKIFILALLTLFAFLLIKAQLWLYQLELYNIFYYFAFLVNLIFVLTMIAIISAKSKKGFRNAQQLSKLLMVAGILSMIFIPTYAEKFF